MLQQHPRGRLGTCWLHLFPDTGRATVSSILSTSYTTQSFRSANYTTVLWQFFP